MPRRHRNRSRGHVAAIAFADTALPAFDVQALVGEPGLDLGQHYLAQLLAVALHRHVDAAVGAGYGKLLVVRYGLQHARAGRGHSDIALQPLLIERPVILLGDSQSLRPLNG